MVLKIMEQKTKNLVKNILAVGLLIVSAVGAVFSTIALIKKNEETPKESRYNFEIGGLTEEGKYLETKESIYTKDMFECQGLTVKMAFDNDISYRVFYYDLEDKFVSATERLTEDYTSDTDIFVKSARIVITPNDDQEVAWYEKNGYAKQLTIEVDKEQKGLPKEYFYDFSNEEIIYAVIGAEYRYNSTTNLESNKATSIQIDISRLKAYYSKVTFLKKGGDGMIIWMFKERAVVGQTAKFCDGITPVNAIQEVTIDIPSDCNVIAFCCDLPGYNKDKTPNAIIFSN